MSERLESLDVARGFDMLWIMGLSGLVIAVCGAFGYGPETAIAAQMEHLHWDGLHFFDFIFPTFIFIAGISFPYSLAKQRERGVATSRTLLRIGRRVLALVLLGFVYNGMLVEGPSHSIWGSVLARIGLAWGIAAVLTVLVRGVIARVCVCAAILVGYWALSVFVAAPDAPAGALPWSFEGCLAGWFDRKFMPGALSHPGVISSQGLLSTLPAVATAMLGIFTGEYVRNGPGSGERKSAVMIVAAALLAISGVIVAHGFGKYSFPFVKKLWSTSYVLACAGYSLALFAVCYYLIDVRHWWKRTLFFRVIGLNAITIYLAQNLFDFAYPRTRLFSWLSTLVPAAWSPVVLQVGYIAICWSLLLFLHRRKIYLKV